MSKYTDKLCGMDAYGRYVPTQDGKKTDKEGIALDGATIEVYHLDAQNQKVIDRTGTTPDNGTLTFQDLPIYGSDGNKIIYYIHETKAPSGYYGTATELTTTLNPGEIVTTVDGAKDGEELALVNNRYQRVGARLHK
mgnify:CR=1 FL=1